jgi:hypothetical protein
MELSRIVGSLALLLAAVVVTGYAVGQDSPPTAQETAQAELEKKKAQHSAAMVEQKRHNADFVQRCSNRGMSHAELEACRAAYQRL